MPKSGGLLCITHPSDCTKNKQDREGAWEGGVSCAHVHADGCMQGAGGKEHNNKGNHEHFAKKQRRDDNAEQQNNKKRRNGAAGG